MPLFGHKDKHHKDNKDVVVTDTTDRDSVHSGHGSHHHERDTTAPIDKSQEFKYERVEKIDVDSSGNAQLKDVREDRGSEDPGMNFKDKRPPALVPGAPAGYVADITDVEGSRGHRIANDRTSIHSSSHRSSHDSAVVTDREPSLIEERHVVRESNLPEATRMQRSISGESGDTASIASSVSSVSSLSRPSVAASYAPSNRVEMQQQSTTASRVIRQEAPRLERDVNNLENQVDRLQQDVAPEQRSYHEATYTIPGNRDNREFYSETIQQSTQPEIREQWNRAPVYQQGNDIIIPGQHRQVIEEREVIQGRPHTHTQMQMVQVPVQRTETSNMEHVRSGYTYTSDKEMVIPGPMLAPPIPSVTHDLLAQGSGGVHAEIHANTNVDLLTNANLKDMGPEEYERYRSQVENLAHQHEIDTAQKAAQYRNQVEQDAELIRRTLERQHIRDIEFRKDLVESAVDRQQHEIQLEAEYAMRALEQEREAARRALDQAKMETNIDVRVDSAVGTTISRGAVHTESGHEVRESQNYNQPGRPL